VLATKLADWIGRLGPVWVEGQLTEVNRRGSTAYLTLRDPSVDVSVSMVCSREVLAACAPEPQVGARVVAFGRMEYWERNGRLSFRAREIRHVGEGELAARIEALRLALEAEGLFRASRKRRLPVLPTAVGLITGRSSAAERDVQRIATSRWPGVRMVVRNVAVQGPKAVAEVIGALRELDRDPAVDVILIARGGGRSRTCCRSATRR
jgi:exodeoxyribonuclease VII large subunit